MNHFLCTILLGATLATSAYAESSPAPAPPRAPLPVEEFTLSFLQEIPHDRCQWMRFDEPGAAPRAVFTFHGACHATHVAWSHDGLKGVVLQMGRVSARPRAWTVDLVTGQGAPLPLPRLGLTTHLGFDATGALVALVRHDEKHDKSLKRVREAETEVLIFKGQKYSVSTNPSVVAGLAHAFRWTGKAWTQLETKATGYEYYDAEEVRVLDAYGELGMATSLYSPYRVDPDEFSAVEEDSRWLATISPDPRPDLSWESFKTPGGLFVVRSSFDDFVYHFLPLYAVVGHKLVQLEAQPQDEEISLSLRGNALLINTGKAVRLYDVKKKKRVFSRDNVWQADFWPKIGGRAAAASEVKAERGGHSSRPHLFIRGL